MPYFCEGTFQKLFGGNFFKNHLAGTLEKTLGGNNFKNIFGGNILAGTFWREISFFYNSKTLQNALFQNKGAET